jgi:hypothetical protein
MAAFKNMVLMCDTKIADRQSYASGGLQSEALLDILLSDL